MSALPSSAVPSYRSRGGAAARKPFGNQQKSDYASYISAGATELSKQPAEAPRGSNDNDPAFVAAWNELRGHLEGRLTLLRSWRISWLQSWSLLAEYILPRRSLWLTGGALNQPVPNSMVRGLPINQSIIDSTGTMAMRVCAAGLFSGLTNPSRKWFELTVNIRGWKPDSSAKQWLDDVADILYDIMAGSNYYDSRAQQDEDLVTFGTAPMIIYEDEDDIIRCYNPCVGEYYLANSSAFRPESLFRQFVLTTAQCVEMFGLENCPRDVQMMWQTKGAGLEYERIVAHAIEPNFPLKSIKGNVEIVDRKYPYREVYWLWGMSSQYPMSVRGFDDPPFTSPRWATTSNDAYGRSPGMDALPDIMQLQLEQMRKAEAIEKQVRPPLLASIELKNEPSSILPGEVTYVTQLGPGNGMRPVYEVNPDLNAMAADITQVQARINSCFYKDLFLLNSEASKDMTAFEVAKRDQEKLQVLGPVIERQYDENIAPAVKRIYSIALRRGLLPPPPASMHGMPLTIKPVSILELAQRSTATASMERYVQVIGGMSARPELQAAIDTINPVRFATKYAELLDMPEEVMSTDREIKQIQSSRAAAMQQQAQIQNAQSLAQGAQTLSQTTVGGGQNALSMLAGIPGGAAPR